MRLGADSVLLTAAVPFQRRLGLDEVEQALEPLKREIKVSYPSIQHLHLESGAIKTMSRSARQLPDPAAPRTLSPPS
jgi:hypothetical protein